MKTIHIIGSPTSDGQVALGTMSDFLNQAYGQTSDIAVTTCRMDEVVYLIDQQECRMLDHKNGTDLRDNDLVWFRGKLAPVITEAATIANYLQAHRVPVSNSFFAQRRGVGKINQMYVLANNGLPIPKTLSAANNILPEYIGDYLSYPLILKDTHGAHGDQNYLVKDHTELLDILQKNPDVRFMAQEFIKGEGDYRILFAGSEYLIIKRLGAADTHLNNTSQGATATLIPHAEFSQEIINQARKFADVCEYEIAGVDVIIDSQTGQHYFLEINSQPQLATGAFLVEKKQLVGDYFKSLVEN